MIVSRTPFRVSFFGGGTDLPEFYLKHTGRVLSTSIDKYMYLFVHKFFDERIQIKYSKTELVEKISDIKHPLAREILKKFNLNGIDINSIADIPAGTGLGSSSSYTVGLLKSLYKYSGIEIKKQDLAEEASFIEINILKEPIGKQDQYASAFGGLNLISFHKDKPVSVEEIKLRKKTSTKLQENLLMFYTGKTRTASSILKEQKKRTANKEEVLQTLCKMSDLALEGAEALKSDSLNDFGILLNNAWELKKTITNNISNKHLDLIYEKGIDAGALGDKVLGAGGGGFIIFYVDKKNHKDIRNSLVEYRELRFNFEKNGSSIIYP